MKTFTRSPFYRVIIGLAALAFGTSAATAALVAHWPLDADADDATGNGHHGAVVGGTVNFGQAGANPNTGGAASFPDNGHIDVPYSPDLNPGIQAPDGSGSFTVALWANSSDNGGFNSPFTAREDNGVTVNGPIIYNNPDGNWSYWAGNNGGPGAWNLVNSNPVPLNTWQHVAITYDSTTVTRKMYLDGIEVLSDPRGVSANILRDLHIGAGQDDGNNFFWNGLIDDVGLWDEALDEAAIQAIMTGGIATGTPDPSLFARSPVDLDLDGTVQQFDIEIRNNGATQDLTVSEAEFTGDPNFSVVALPAAIPPGGTGDLTIEFDPSGSNGAFEADLEITSNDSLTPTRTVVVRGSIHDPMLASDAVLDLGTALTGSLAVMNGGANRTLNITQVALSGEGSGNFQITSFPAMVAPGASGNVEVSFNGGGGGEGRFRATMTITSDDPLNPETVVDVLAFVEFTNTLVAWWPLDVDGTDASGNGFDGVPTQPLTVCPGATGLTGSSLEFDGSSTRIDVPFDEALNPQDFTVTLWANAATTANFASPITSRDDVAGPITHGYILYNNSGGNWDFWTGDGDAGWDGLVGPPVTLDTWSHLAISYDSATDTKTLYVDGDVAATDNTPQSGATQYVVNGTIESEDLHIGAGQDDGNNFWFQGKIDDVALFRVALPETDIESIMTNGVSGFTGSGGLFQMLPLTFGPAAGQVTVSWTSVDGAVYALERTTDLTAPGTTVGSWEELDDGINSGGETTSFIDSLPEGATRLYYRATRVQ